MDDSVFSQWIKHKIAGEDTQLLPEKAISILCLLYRCELLNQYNCVVFWSKAFLGLWLLVLAIHWSTNYLRLESRIFGEILSVSLSRSVGLRMRIILEISRISNWPSLFSKFLCFTKNCVCCSSTRLFFLCMFVRVATWFQQLLRSCPALAQCSLELFLHELVPRLNSNACK